MTVAGIFAECSFNFFIIIVFAFLLDCWIAFSESDKLFPDIFDRRLVATRSNITVFLFWNHIWNQIYAYILILFHLHLMLKARRPTLLHELYLCLHLYEVWQGLCKNLLFCKDYCCQIHTFSKDFVPPVVCLNLS